MPFAHLLIAACLLVQEDPLQKQVTFIAHADSAERVLANLSREAGVILGTSTTLGKEILVLRLAGVPLRDAMARISEAVAGHWEAAGSGYLLVRSAKDVAPIHAERRKTCRELLAAMLPAARKEASAAGRLTQSRALANFELEKRLRDEKADSESTEREFEDYEDERRKRAKDALSGSAEARFLLRILEGIGIERLAEICAGDKDVVLATNPTSLQLPFPFNPGLWEDYTLEHNDFVSAFLQTRPPREPGELYFGSMDRWGPSGGTTIISEPAGKIILKLTPGLIGSYPSVDVEGSFYGIRGNLISSGDLEIMPLSKRADEPPPFKPPHEEPLSLSKEAVEMASLVDWSIDEDDQRKPSPELLHKMLRPNEFEPLSLLASEVLVEVARRREKNLAACLPDAAYLSIGYGVEDGRATPNSILEELNDYSTTLIDREGWLVVRPADPTEAQAERFSRAAMARILQKGHKTGTLTIEDFADFAFACAGDERGISNHVIDCTLRKAYHVDMGFNDWRLLKLYGSFSPKQRHDLQAGRPVAFQQLSAKQATWIKALILSENMVHRSYEEDENAEPDLNDLIGEPTEALAGGLPPTGWITLKQRSDQDLEIISQNEEGDSIGESGDLEAVAWRLYLNRHPELQEGPVSSVIRIRPRTRISMEFHFHLNRKLAWQADLSETRWDKGKGYTPGSLLEEMRDQIAKFFKQFDEQVKNGEITPPDRSDQGTGIRKPPPPDRQ